VGECARRAIPAPTGVHPELAQLSLDLLLEARCLQFHLLLDLNRDGVGGNERGCEGSHARGRRVGWQGSEKAGSLLLRQFALFDYFVATV